MVEVGKVRDAHGLKGELFLMFFAEEAAWLDKAKTLKLDGAFPQKDGKHTRVTKELTIKNFRPHKKGVILKFVEIPDRTEAEKFIGFTISIPKDLLTSQKGEEIFLKEIEGFTAFDGEKQLGVIEGFSTNGAQDILVVKGETKTIEIPLVKEFVSEILWDQKQIRLKLPEGLTD
jgi:16S rRNA processing protein RimM